MNTSKNNLKFSKLKKLLIENSFSYREVDPNTAIFEIVKDKVKIVLPKMDEDECVPAHLIQYVYRILTEKKYTSEEKWLSELN